MVETEPTEWVQLEIDEESDRVPFPVIRARNSTYSTALCSATTPEWKTKTLGPDPSMMRDLLRCFDVWQIH